MSDGNNNEIEIEATPDENEKKEIIPDENEIEKKETITGDDPLTYSQIYYRTNKKRQLDYVSEKKRCECGAVIARISWARHLRTKKHLSNIRHNEFVEDCKNGKYADHPKYKNLVPVVINGVTRIVQSAPKNARVGHT